MRQIDWKVGDQIKSVRQHEDFIGTLVRINGDILIFTWSDWVEDKEWTVDKYSISNSFKKLTKLEKALK